LKKSGNKLAKINLKGCLTLVEIRGIYFRVLSALISTAVSKP